METKDRNAIEVFIKDNSRRFARQFYYSQLVGEEAVTEIMLADVMEKLQNGVGFRTSDMFALKSLAIITDSKWDSDVLGKRVGKLSLYFSHSNDETRSLLQKTCRAARKMGFEALFGRIDMQQMNVMQVILSEGAILGDVLLTFAKNLHHEEIVNRVCAFDRSALKFEEGKIADQQELGEITSLSYKHSHYYNDPNIPLAEAEKVYQEWVRNSLAGFANVILVARLKEEIVGYITFRLQNLNSKAYATIDLIATKQEYRDQGIGKMLVSEGIKRIHDMTDILYVSTQVSNLPALQLYERLGFRPILSEATLHIWLKPKKTRKSKEL